MSDDRLVWVLVVTPDGEPGGASIHPTRAAAVESLRANWDDLGDFDELDEDGLINQLSAHCGVTAVIESHHLDWPLS